ncbi:hypothetical protein DAI22_03g209800 [Oryza sativa Japonica Group]|uniref:Uncharacterized protein n=1 Tax=Oryza rufipogon TaxID=4529 RepID=A0A0E0NWA3_ORYRU|nr:hypothetical protein DAI22_03g209800 [Oryza sativa Japonica Group]
MRNHNLLVPTTTTTTTTTSSSSSSSKNNAANKQQQQQEPPHLSGAYIRSLVKQLSSSSSTARSNKDHTTTMGTSKPHGCCHPQPDQQEPQTTPPPPQPQPQPHKKQVRRRLHTSRPYQERLLNMAEARREIVTALKIHRASMRQAKEQQQLLHLQHHHHHQQQEVVATQVAAAVQEQQIVEQAAASTRSSANSAAAAMHHGYASFSDYLYNSPLTHLSSSPAAYSSPVPYHAPPPPPMAAAAQAQLGHGDLLPLPAQPLGLNLSFHGFTSVVADVCDGDGGKQGSSTGCLEPYHPLLHQPSPASSYSVYSSPSVTTTAAAGGGQDMSPSALITTAENTSSQSQLAAAEIADPSLHRVLDDEEMAAIYSIGEQHDIEWSDTVNLVTSAWWSKLLDTVEGGAGAAASAVAAGGAVNASAAAAAAEEEEELTAARMAPDWFGGDGGHLVEHHQSSKESGSDVLGMHFGEYYHHGHGIGSYGEDVSLPRMDLGEIEGWNAEWFS